VARVVVIANPVASQFTGGAHRDVMSILTANHQVEALWPSTATEAADMSEAMAADGADVVVAMGGDGMVHHISQGLIGTGAALGIIPAGTTNVIARLLGIPSRHTKAAKLIGRHPAPTSVGVVRMTLQRGTVETIHHAIFACGVGLDAEVVIRADQDPYRKYRFGSVHYLRTAVGVALGKFAGIKPHIAATDGERTAMASTVLVQFREVYTYFGKLPIRLADQPPRPMTILSLDRLRRSRVPQVAIDALLGRDLTRVKGAEVWEEVHRLVLEADPPMATQADGEALGVVDSAVIEWVPTALTVIAGDRDP
jgi:diacylglycerol kinase family enzyme